MDETDTIKGVWLGALSIAWSYPLATLVPSVVLGAIGEVPSYLIDERRVLDLVVSLVTAYLAYYLYLAYAEGIVGKVRRGEQRRGLSSFFDDLTGALRYVPGVVVAALIVVTITSAATLLLVVPGVWLYARWSLTTPVIREANVGPLTAMRRSRELVRGRFWFVFMTASVAYYLEGVVVDLGAAGVGSMTGSYTWGSGWAARSWLRWSCPWRHSPPPWPTPASRNRPDPRPLRPNLPTGSNPGIVRSGTW